MIHSPGNRPLDWFCSTILLRQRTGPNSLQNGSLNWPATQIARLQNSVPERNQTCPLIGRQFLINSSQSEPMIPGPIIKNLREKDLSETSWKIALSYSRISERLLIIRSAWGSMSPYHLWLYERSCLGQHRPQEVQWDSVDQSHSLECRQGFEDDLWHQPRLLQKEKQCLWHSWAVFLESLRVYPPQELPDISWVYYPNCIPEQFWMRCE